MISPEQNRQSYFERFERENSENWEKLYASLNRDEDETLKPERSIETSRKFFHIKGKYIVCPVISGLMLIDQKRAHERILFERYLELPQQRKSVSQADLFPVTQEMNPSDLLILKDIEKETYHHLDSGFSTLIAKVLQLPDGLQLHRRFRSTGNA